MRKSTFGLLIALAVASFAAQADQASAQKLADKYAAIAKNIDPAYPGLNADAGKAFFNRELTIHGKQVACASCHTDNPANAGMALVMCVAAGFRGDASRFEKAGFADVRIVTVPDNALLRVRIGRFNDARGAADVLSRLTRAGYKAVVVTDATRETVVRD